MVGTVMLTWAIAWLAVNMKAVEASAPLLIFAMICDCVIFVSLAIALSQRS
jgi:predicted RND superfamily exporter protein